MAFEATVFALGRVAVAYAGWRRALRDASTTLSRCALARRSRPLLVKGPRLSVAPTVVLVFWGIDVHGIDRTLGITGSRTPARAILRLSLCQLGGNLRIARIFSLRAHIPARHSAISGKGWCGVVQPACHHRHGAAAPRLANGTLREPRFPTILAASGNDSEAQGWPVSPVLSEEKPQDREATEPGHVPNASGRPETRAGGAVLQARWLSKTRGDDVETRQSAMRA
jgi:hypothetical protein